MKVLGVATGVLLLAARMGSAQDTGCFLGIPDTAPVGTVLSINLAPSRMTVDHPALFVTYRSADQLPASNEAAYKRVALRIIDAKQSMSFLIDREGTYSFALQSNVTPAWPQPIPGGVDVCMVSLRGTRRQDRPFGDGFQSGIEAFVWEYRHDVDMRHFAIQAVALDIFFGHGNQEFGLVAGAMGWDTDELYVGAHYHHAMTKGSYGGGVLFGALPTEHLSAPAVDLDVSVRTPQVFDRPFWIVVDYRQSLTDRDEKLPSWAIRVGIRYDFRRVDGLRRR